MNQRQAIALAMRVRPAWLSRRKCFDLACDLHAFCCKLTFPFRDPRLWWFCRRLDLHLRFGFPRPLSDREHGILRA